MEHSLFSFEGHLVKEPKVKDLIRLSYQRRQIIAILLEPWEEYAESISLFVVADNAETEQILGKTKEFRKPFEEKPYPHYLPESVEILNK